MPAGNTNCRPGSVKINLGDKVDIFKLRPRTSNKNCRLGPVNTNWGPRPVNKNIGTKTGKVNLLAGSQGRHGGKTKDQRPGNRNALIDIPNNSVFHNLQNDFTTEIA